MKQLKGVVFCDLAGTLSFHNIHNKMCDVTQIGGGFVDLKDPISGEICRVKESLVQEYKMYTDPETVRLLELVKEDYHLVYVTGSRPSTITSLAPVLIPPHATILESGAVIYLDGYGKTDEDWSQTIIAQIADLNVFVAELKSQGWVINDQGRTSAVRIFPCDNPHLTMDDFERLAQKISVEKPTLKTSWNVGGMDIVPEKAGKGNAIEHYLKNHMSKISCQAENTIGVGDDINDLEMFDRVKTRLVVRGCHQEILDMARKNNWYISKGVHFRGINEILQLILDQ